MRRSFAVYLAMMAYLAAVKGIIRAYPAALRSSAQTAVFAWPCLGIVTAVGLLGVWLGARVGLPGVWDAGTPLRRRCWFPMGLGLRLGAVSIAVDATTHRAATVSEAMTLPSIHCLLPIPLVMWIVVWGLLA